MAQQSGSIVYHYTLEDARGKSHATIIARHRRGRPTRHQSGEKVRSQLRFSYSALMQTSIPSIQPAYTPHTVAGTRSHSPHISPHSSSSSL